VSETDRRHLFERFFRARTVTDMAIPGTGLGLPIVDLIAQAHGGSVRYVPHEGAGSTFEIRLPVAPTPAQAPAQAQAPAEPSDEGRDEGHDDVRRDGVRLGEQA
jgi:K+-sensing histidine kinase KdpD